MSGPVDVQAERLRELAQLADRTNGADWPWRKRIAYTPVELFIAACDPQTVLALLDLLAGQAEQIERAVRQRDNLRDALQDIASMTVMSVEGTQMKYWAEKALAALRAAAVGEDTE